MAVIDGLFGSPGELVVLTQALGFTAHSGRVLLIQGKEPSMVGPT